MNRFNRTSRALMALMLVPILILCACEPEPTLGPTADPLQLQTAPPLPTVEATPVITPAPTATPEPEPSASPTDSPFNILSAAWQSFSEAPSDIMLMPGEALAFIEVVIPPGDGTAPPLVMLIDGNARAPRLTQLVVSDEMGEQWALWFVSHQTAKTTVIVEESNPEAELAALTAPGAVRTDNFDSILGSVVLYRPVDDSDIRMVAPLQHPTFPKLPAVATVVAAQSIMSRSYRESRMAACNLPLGADPMYTMAEQLGMNPPVTTADGWTLVTQLDGFTVLVQAKYGERAVDMDGPRMRTVEDADSMAMLVALLAPGWNSEVAGDDDPPVKGAKGQIMLSSLTLVESIIHEGKPYAPAEGNVLVLLTFSAEKPAALKAALAEWKSAQLQSASGVKYSALAADEATSSIIFEAQSELVYPQTLRWFGETYQLPLP